MPMLMKISQALTRLRWRRARCVVWTPVEDVGVVCVAVLDPKEIAVMFTPRIHTFGNNLIARCLVNKRRRPLFKCGEQVDELDGSTRLKLLTACFMVNNLDLVRLLDAWREAHPGVTA